MAVFFLFFFVSGLCGLVYQIVWLRIAMADFGVTMPSVSIVLSVFMAGLALGSWGAGRLMRETGGSPPSRALRLYGFAEAAIAASGLLVVPSLALGRGLLAEWGGDALWGSVPYYFASGGWIALVLLPPCTCMGATFPLAMAAIRGARPEESDRSFSYLYVANVLGAVVGTLGSAFVAIEVLGFRGTTLLAAALNASIATAALVLSRRIDSPRGASFSPPPRVEAAAGPPLVPAGRLLLALLFTTGFVSLAMEVVWTRQFIPYQGTAVYAFAFILAIYLAATVAGSRFYRLWVRQRSPVSLAAAPGWVALIAATLGLLPLLAGDPRIPLGVGLAEGGVRVALGVGPFSMVLGFLTPMVVDRWSSGDPEHAGSAYAINAIGCILGPLAAGFLLLPLAGEGLALLILATPLFALGLALVSGAVEPIGERLRVLLQGAMAGGLPAFLLVALTQDQTASLPGSLVRRDHTATVIAAGSGMERQLLINGQGTTTLTPITKMMAHLPLASLPEPPQRGLVLCFGMGTSFRSMISWGIPTTAVELVPSVPGLLGFFHDNGDDLLHSHLARIVVDDARRFLERTPERFDVIVIDPPPPIEAAGSSLLYSREFYRIARARLNRGGILHQWLPWGSAFVTSAFARALVGEFRYVRAFRSVEGWGIHFLASDHPIPRLSPAQLAARLPPSAALDLLEWGPTASAEDQLALVLGQEVAVDRLLALDPDAPGITDDRPVNEYFLLRALMGRERQAEIR